MHIYKICTRMVWDETERSGLFPGMPIDVADGYVHFSTAEQSAETARKYFAGKTDLVLLTVDADMLGDALRWEASSGGNSTGLFPHLYGVLPRTAIISATAFDVPQ